MRKPDRAEHLSLGLKRLLAHDQALTLEALILYPHALCRAAESVGPVETSAWDELAEKLTCHRLWGVERGLNDDEFWQVADDLAPHRDLPQVLLDFLDVDGPRETAPVEEFKASLQRFLVRERIEKIRHTIYRWQRSHDTESVVSAL